MFPLPVLDVINTDSTAGVYVLACSDEHVICGYDVNDRWQYWVLSHEPYCDGYVVRCTTKRDRE
jgi:hypothetical protein